MKRRILIFVCCFMLILLSACGNGDGENKTNASGTENNTSEIDSESAKAEEMRKRFGENCIGEQTFEVELSEYSEKVYFVPFKPEGSDLDCTIQIVQNGEVLETLDSYVPDELLNEEFTSLDAVSFYDVNFDDQTDIVLIETYGTTSFAVIYYGYVHDYNDKAYFVAEKDVSAKIFEEVDQMTISGVRSYLSNGKNNGEFSSYQEAYQAVSKLCELEYANGLTYNLIFFDDDDIPELAAGSNGYFVSLYTYHDGRIYTLMDAWAYGAWGNNGYEYSPRKNSLRNDDQDYAGLIHYTTYLTVNSEYSMESVVQIKTLFFNDVNGNQIPDDDETYFDGYSTSYIDGVEVTDEQCASYDMGEYEFIKPTMSWEELQVELDKN